MYPEDYNKGKLLPAKVVTEDIVSAQYKGGVTVEDDILTDDRLMVLERISDVFRYQGYRGFRRAVETVRKEILLRKTE